MAKSTPNRERQPKSLTLPDTEREWIELFKNQSEVVEDLIRSHRVAERGRHLLLEWGHVYAEQSGEGIQQDMLALAYKLMAPKSNALTNKLVWSESQTKALNTVGDNGFDVESDVLINRPDFTFYNGRDSSAAGEKVLDAIEAAQQFTDTTLDDRAKMMADSHIQKSHVESDRTPYSDIEGDGRSGHYIESLEATGLSDYL